MKNVDILLLEYYDSFIKEVNDNFNRFLNQKLDSYLFSELAESYLARYVGKLDALFDVEIISYEIWKNWYSSASEYVNDRERQARKIELEPSDPPEEG